MLYTLSCLPFPRFEHGCQSHVVAGYLHASMSSRLHGGSWLLVRLTLETGCKDGQNATPARQPVSRQPAGQLIDGRRWTHSKQSSRPLCLRHKK